MDILDMKDAVLRATAKAQQRAARARAHFYRSLQRAKTGEQVEGILSDPGMEQFYQDNHPIALEQVRRRYGQGKLR